MQLEAKMKPRASWTALLLLAACLVHSSLGDQCTSNGIVGTFSREPGKAGDPDNLDSLTITPVNYKNTLDVDIGKTDEDHSVQIYMILDKEAEASCTSGSFEITGDGKTCKFDYTYGDEKFKIEEQTLEYDSADPYQASFELRVEGTTLTALVQSSSGEEFTLKSTPPTCLKFDGKFTNFTMTFNKSGTVECGVQFEMKGSYEATKLIADGETCILEAPGSTNDLINANGTGETTTGPKVEPTTTSSIPWMWIGIGVGGFLLIVIVIIVVVVIVCVMKKKKGSDDEDAESAPEESDNVQPTDIVQPTDAPITAGQGVATSGVDPTQNPEEKTDDE